MLACTRAASGMVLDAPSSNGPFQPVALMHFRGEKRKFTSFAALCLWLQTEREGERVRRSASFESPIPHQDC
uniref:Uncharacterized protein n=1 Tax=Seriola lalandi dorsalis TaxID=1841481 RepID=A0A3B4WDR1_SERLL